MNELDILELLSVDGTDDVPAVFAGIVGRLVEFGLIVRGPDVWVVTETGHAILEKQEATAH